MPELSDDMYCSEQICIPPTFPYLLRQYAKAAIRTQPSDLLKWSAAYFRCLSLGVPPPVKPRLEYPIPKDYHGLTPGWLKALLHQLGKAQAVHFKVLWDRWIGACLVHENLIQILCLARFRDNTAVPWLRFLAMCAGFLSDCLTQTMIVICELLTEEPEGGSAMISLEIFIDLYKFLAKIDASTGQWLPNLYFTDSILSLFKKKAEEEVQKLQEEEEAKEEVIEMEEVIEAKEVEARKKDEISIISCPSVHEDDYGVGIETYLKQMEVAGEDEENLEESIPKLPQAEVEEDDEPMYKGPSDTSLGSISGEGSKGSGEADKAEVAEDAAAEQPQEGEEEEEKAATFDITEPETEKKDDNESMETYDPASEEHRRGSKMVEALKKDGVDLLVEEDLEKLKTIHAELCGETDEELEKLKKMQVGEVHKNPSDDERLAHYDTKIYMSDETPSDDGRDKSTIISTVEDEEEKPQEMIYVEAIPGIGAIVPDELIEAVCKYMKEMAKDQHGMVMPRNIRHYNCPPLELFPKC